GNTRQQSGIRDLVSVQMKDRKHGAITDRVQKFIGMPRGSERSGLCLSISDDDTHNQIGIVESRSERVRHTVTKLAAFVDRAWNLRRAVAAKLAGEREGSEQVEHAHF